MKIKFAFCFCILKKIVSLAANAPECDVFTKKMHETPKMVFSNTLTESIWDNVQIGRNIVADIAALMPKNLREISLKNYL